MARTVFVMTCPECKWSDKCFERNSCIFQQCPLANIKRVRGNLDAVLDAAIKAVQDNELDKIINSWGNEDDISI